MCVLRAYIVTHAAGRVQSIKFERDARPRDIGVMAGIGTSLRLPRRAILVAIGLRADKGQSKG